MTQPQRLYLGPAGLDATPRVVPVVTGTYAASFGDLVPVDASSGSCVVTLPAATMVGKVKVHYMLGTDRTVAVVATPGGDTIDGLPTTTMYLMGETRTFSCDGHGGWYTSASGPAYSVVTPRVLQVNTNLSVSGIYAMPDIHDYQAHDLTLVGDATLVFPADPRGRWWWLALRQDAVGGHTVTWPANVRKPQGAFNLTLTAGAVDLILCIAVRATHWGAVLVGKDFA